MDGERLAREIHDLVDLVSNGYHMGATEWKTRRDAAYARIAQCTQSPPLLVKYRSALVADRLPFKHAKEGDCGYDLGYAPDPEWEGVARSEFAVFPNTFGIVPTGVSVKIPDGHFGLLCGRSSTFGKRGLFVVESRIDSGYTGQLFVKVWHPAVYGDAFKAPPGIAVIRAWERFAQLVIIPYNSPALEVVDGLPQTERGATGFGSSGA